MHTGLLALLVAQFLSAFADNAVLFALVALVMQTQAPAWYVPALQASFLLAFVLLAPWAGPLADRLPKPRVLVLGNLLKLAGTFALLAGAEPLAAYALVGLGAAGYSPAKYGVLPELVADEQLVRANGWMEASTIGAIVAGMVAGAALGDASVTKALWVVAGLYGLSIAATLLMPPLPARGGNFYRALPEFLRANRALWHETRAAFALAGGSLFWGSGAVLRVALVAWAATALGSRSAADVADLSLFLALGVILGSITSARLFPLRRLARSAWLLVPMGSLILLLAGLHSLGAARVVLFGIGLAGGLFVVPVNAALQASGHRLTGAGHAVAVQNFFQNLAMLVGVGVYSAALGAGASVSAALAGLGLGLSLAGVRLARR
ncbi:MAG TPA: lysophospholipid transporter LplT [Gammaproteobacteria bacterium]|nr:lysophospholipid transporter LplT [Gammaproteobacteria bacterium]